MKQRFIIVKLTENNNAFFPDTTLEVIGEFRPNELFTICQYVLSYQNSHHFDKGCGIYKLKILNDNNLTFELIEFKKF